MIPTFTELKTLATLLGYTLTKGKGIPTPYTVENVKFRYRSLDLSSIHRILINPLPLAWIINYSYKPHPKSRRQP